MIAAIKAWLTGLSWLAKTIVGITGVSALALAGGAGQNVQQTPLQDTQSISSEVQQLEESVKPKPICDGTQVTSNCVLDEIEYKTYIYYPAELEKFHTEQVVTYEEEITGYCTLCSDGTYSPSCATGRGACSWHGGVAEWNAPVYRKVPKYSTKKIVDSPAKKAYFEKVLAN